MPHRLRRRILLILLALAGCGAAHAQVHRCTGADGIAVYTDRRCADLGATENNASNAGLQRTSRLSRNGCAHSLQDLLYELGTAIDSADVNRLAGVYHWVGMSSGHAATVMRRLDVIAHRPLADIVPLYAGDGDGSDDYYPQTTMRRTPIGVRLEQTLANGSTPARTTLGLRRYLGCWWVRL